MTDFIHSIQSLGIVMTLILCSATLGYFLKDVSAYTFNENIIGVAQEEYVNISCGSDSMGVLMDCHTKAEVTPFNINDTPKLGRIYIYKQNETVNVIHRLVACKDDNCTVLIFKGDNNIIADKPVNKSQIVYNVIALRYE